jgi:branched-chain amino acid transport system ATP-binding protein
MNATTGSAAHALRVRGVTRRFGGLVAVRGVDLDVAPGERRVVLGPNGAGKSTLFNLVAGDLRVSEGTVEVGGTDVTALGAHRRARLGVARTYQRSTLFGNLDVADNLRMALLAARGARLGLLRRTVRALDADVRGLAEQVGLADELGVPAGTLSHGRQRQLELGIALAGSPRLLLLDEPAAGLSPAERTLLAGLLAGLPRDITVVLIEHDMDVALPFADVVTVMHDGVVVEEGDADHVAASAVVHEIYLGTAAGSTHA